MKSSVFSDYTFETSQNKDVLVNTEENTFPYALGRPDDTIKIPECNDLVSLESYYDSIITDFMRCQEDQIAYADASEKIWSKEELLTKLNTVIHAENKCMYAEITYPLTNPALIKFNCTQPITYGMVLYLFTVAYQLVYDLEEQDDGHPGQISPTLINRATSEGRFGIWGHDISDLLYNSVSTIKIYENHIFVDLSCDS